MDEVRDDLLEKCLKPAARVLARDSKMPAVRMIRGAVAEGVVRGSARECGPGSYVGVVAARRTGAECTGPLVPPRTHSVLGVWRARKCPIVGDD